MGKHFNAFVYQQMAPLPDDTYEPDYESDTKYGYCRECECNVQTVKMDFGIGSYEYWGCKGVHTDVRQVCPSCEGEVEDERAEEEQS